MVLMNSCPRESLIRRNTIVFIFSENVRSPNNRPGQRLWQGMRPTSPASSSVLGICTPHFPLQLPSAVSELPRLSIYMKIFFTFVKNIRKNVLSCILFSEFRYPCFLLFYSLKRELFYEISFKFGHEVEERPRKTASRKVPSNFSILFSAQSSLSNISSKWIFSARTLFFITQFV